MARKKAVKRKATKKKKNQSVKILSLVAAIIFVRNYFNADLGDHFLAVIITTFIYYLSYLVFIKSS